MPVTTPWRRARGIVEFLSHLAVLIGIGVTAFEYGAHKAERREEIALAHLQDLQAPHIMDARLRLAAYWRDRPLSELSGLPGSAGVIDDLAMAQVFAPGQQAIDDLLRVVESLDVLGDCLAADTCAEDVLRARVGAQARSIACIYRAPIARLRDDYALTQLGHGLRLLSEEAAACLNT